MRREKIEGVGSIYGGEYESILVEGMGKLKGDAKVQTINIDGTFKSKGRIIAEKINIDGFARIYRDIKVKHLTLEGTLKLRRANVNAELVHSDGFLTSTKEISADEILIKGTCSVKKLTGDQIQINHQAPSGKNVIHGNWLIAPYFGRKVSTNRCLVDVIECTHLKANGLNAKIVRAGSVRLEDCRINRLYCDSEPKMLKNCKIKHIYYGVDKTELRQKEKNMENVTVKKILDMYKNNVINGDEAELMLKAAITSGSTQELSSQAEQSMGLPWEDDDKLHFVAFLGRKLLKKGEAGEHKLEVSYDGPAKNVECHGSLSCGDIMGNVSAGQSIECRDIGGNVSCGGNLSCKDIDGNVKYSGEISRKAGK